MRDIFLCSMASALLKKLFVIFINLSYNIIILQQSTKISMWLYAKPKDRKADNMKEIKQEFLTGERALFQGHDLRITDTIFDDGESPLKNFTWFEMARAGVWYTGNMTVTDLTLYGNYSFDGAKNVEVHNSGLLSNFGLYLFMILPMICFSTFRPYI